VRRLGLRPVIAVNQFPTDGPNEIDVILEAAAAWSVPASCSTGYAEGGAGAERLAEAVIAVTGGPTPNPPADEHASHPADPVSRVADPVSRVAGPVYRLDDPVACKITAVAPEIYGADGVEFSPAA